VILERPQTLVGLSTDSRDGGIVVHNLSIGASSAMSSRDQCRQGEPKK
jgi:hypothetical protein